MSSQIVDIGDFRLTRDRHTLTAGCEHKHLTLNDEGEFVTCDDCKTQVGTYAALRMLVERWAMLQARIDSQRADIEAAAAKTVELRAAQKVEKAWRRRSMVPLCPHCNEAIFSTDGFGKSMMNKEIATKRRAVAKQNTAETAAQPQRLGS